MNWSDFILILGDREKLWVVLLVFAVWLGYPIEFEVAFALFIIYEELDWTDELDRLLVEFTFALFYWLVEFANVVLIFVAFWELEAFSKFAEVEIFVEEFVFVAFNV